MMGDGELQEGVVWESLMAAPNFSLQNLCLIIDKNSLQVDGTVQDVMDIEPLRDKLQAFKWNVLEIDGHDLTEIMDAFDMAKNHTLGPTVIIAHTVKGKGVSFMENVVEWHGRAPNAQELEQALQELSIE